MMKKRDAMTMIIITTVKLSPSSTLSLGGVSVSFYVCALP